MQVHAKIASPHLMESARCSVEATDGPQSGTPRSSALPKANRDRARSLHALMTGMQRSTDTELFLLTQVLTLMQDSRSVASKEQDLPSFHTGGYP